MISLLQRRIYTELTKRNTPGTTKLARWAADNEFRPRTQAYPSCITIRIILALTIFDLQIQ